MVSIPHSLLFILYFALPSYSQNFAIPSNWRKPTSTATREDRLALVNGVLDTILPTFNSSSGLLDGLTLTQTASLLCALATGDLINSSTTSLRAVTTSLNTAFKLNPNISTDPALWGLAAIDSYRAYKDQPSLGFAKSMWTQLNKFMITAANAIQGIHPLKSVSFPSTCNGASVAGGVFYLTSSPDNLDINAETVAAFMALSAHLYEATSDSTYQEAAELSATFIASQLYNGAVILDTITISNCLTNTDIVTYNSGFTIEGLSVLASKNATFTPFLNSLAATAIPNSAWTNSSDGVNIEGPTSASDAETNDFGIALKAILVRGLYEAWARSPSGSAVADLIASYITVQYNALRDLASTPGSNNYSPRWEGPPPTQFLPWGQLAALDVLNSAAGLVGNTSSITSSLQLPPTNTATTQGPSPSNDNGSPSDQNANNGHRRSSSQTAALVGGIVGAIVAAMMIALVVFLMRRRRTRKRRGPTRLSIVDASPSASSIDPFRTPDDSASQLPYVSQAASQQSPRQISGPSVITLSYDSVAGASRDIVIANSAETQVAFNGDSKRPGPSVEVTTVSPSATQSGPLSTNNAPTPADLPALIERLNIIMAHLPPGGTREDELPEYEPV